MPLPPTPRPLVIPSLAGRIDPAADLAIQQIVLAVRALQAPPPAPPPAPFIPGYFDIAQALAVDGVSPLDVTGLLGVLAQPQITGAPRVETLPDPLLSQDGQLANYQGTLYYFNASTQPRQWIPLGALGTVLQVTHAQRLATYPAAGSPAGTILWETDRAALYATRLVAGIPVWVLLMTRPLRDVLGNRPADLGANDVGYLYFASDEGVLYRWSGGAWNYYMGSLVDIAANLPAAALADRGFIFIASDYGYQIWRKGLVTWEVMPGWGGPMSGTISPDQKPGGLAATDAGFRFFSTDFKRMYKWTGASWLDQQDRSDPRFRIEFFDGLAPGAGWALCDGSVVTSSLSSGGTSTYTTPDLLTANRFLRSNNAAGGTGGAATHLHSVDPPLTLTDGPSTLVQVDETVPTVWVGLYDHTHSVDIAAFNSATADSRPPYYNALPYIRL
jgi:hypothetical protein